MTDNELTPDQYKIEIMKQNTARKFVQYEEEIASLQTRIRMLQQELEKHHNTKNPEVPPPPTEE